MEAIRQYFRESYNELVNKVTWPPLSELQSTTIVVLVASIVIALVIYLMDIISNLLLQNTVY
ncbi:MAG: preprotein translocase subunit SecE [Saprospiraceae bacterium]